MHTFSEPRFSGIVAFSERTSGQCSFHLLSDCQAHHARRASFPPCSLRRLWLPLLSSSRVCRPVDSSGHHRTACAVAGCSGVAGSQWSPQQHECVVKGVDGSRPTSGHRVSEPAGRSRIEILVDLFHGAQIAVDTTLVSVLAGNHPPCQSQGPS